MTVPVAWMYQEGNGKPFASINPPSSFGPNELSENEVSVTRLYPESALTAEREARVKAEAALARVREALKATRLELGYCSQQLVASGWNEGGSVRKAIDDADAALAADKGANHE